MDENISVMVSGPFASMTRASTLSLSHTLPVPHPVPVKRRGRPKAPATAKLVSSSTEPAVHQEEVNANGRHVPKKGQVGVGLSKLGGVIFPRVVLPVLVVAALLRTDRAKKMWSWFLPHNGDKGKSLVAPPSGAVVWFRNDLRTHDHEGLAAAHKDHESVMGVYCFDPREYRKSPSGFPTTGPYRARFILESVGDLRGRLKGMGSGLLVRQGHPEEVLPALAKKLHAGVVYCQGEVSHEDQTIEERVRRALQGVGVELKVIHGGTLYHPEDLNFQLSSMAPHYADFRIKVSNIPVRPPLGTPEELKAPQDAESLDEGQLPSMRDLGFVADRTADRPDASPMAHVQGGETEALRQLEGLLLQVQHSQRVESHGASGRGPARGKSGSTDFSCKISPWLSLGCLSPRYMYSTIRSSLMPSEGLSEPQQQGPSTPLSLVHFELLWRDFFRFVTTKYVGTALGHEALAPCTAS